MSEFFVGTGAPGLALFLNAGDPPLPLLEDLVLMLDAHRVDCLELAVPFPNSFTDGPVVRRSSQRALATGVGLEDVLGFVARVRGRLHHLRIALLADWSYTVRQKPLGCFLQAAASSAVDAVLVHGLPPRLRPAYYQDADDVGLPVVTTCYHRSPFQVLAEAATHGSAYVYLVAHYGRSGSAPPSGYGQLATTISSLRRMAVSKIAVGFGITSGAQVALVHVLGADAAIVGSAVVARIERSLADRSNVIADFGHFVESLRTTREAVDQAS